MRTEGSIVADQAEIHRMAKSKEVEERKKAIQKLKYNIAILENKKQAWEDLIGLISDTDPDVRRGSADALESAFIYVPDKKQVWEDLIRLIVDTDREVRWYTCKVLGSAFVHVPNKKQAWEDLHELTLSSKFDVRWSAAEALRGAFAYVPDKKQAWNDLHRLTSDRDAGVRNRAANVLGSVFSLVPDKEQAYDDLMHLTSDGIIYVCESAVNAIGGVFVHVPDKKQAWKDLHNLTFSSDHDVRWSAAHVLGSVFSLVPDKKQAWDDLQRLTYEGVSWYPIDALGNAFSLVSDKKLAWDDLHKLTFDSESGVRLEVTFALGSAFSHVPNKQQAWEDLHRLTFDNDSYVKIAANHSSGKVCIFMAVEAESEKIFMEKLIKAIKFFEIVSREVSLFNESLKSGGFDARRNPAEFCLPFYRSFFAITFKEEKAEAEVQRYLSEAKNAIEGSECKVKLLEAVENLENALKEVQHARDFNEMKSDLNAYRRYLDRACELLDTTEEKAPGASRLIRRGLPIIDERIKGIIGEIQDKAKALCKQTRGTSFENLGIDVNNAGQNLLNVRDPIGLEKQVQNMLIVLSSICTSMPEEERGDACEFLQKANDEHYIEDKLSSINMVLSKIPPHIRKAIVMTKIEIKNSTNTQVAVGNGNIQKIGASIKPKYGLDETEKQRKVTKSAISIDEKIQQNNTSIEQILDNWGFNPGHGKRDEKKADIKKWLHRFQLSEFEDAFLILERIQYHDGHTVDGYMEGLSKELKKIFENDLSKILFYPLGESPASSGGNLLYSYRKDLGLPESSFPYVPFKNIDLSGKKAIVFFDDIIGSGNQAVRFAEKHLHDIKIDKYYVALMAFEKGLEKVKNNGCFKKVIVHEIISEELRAFSTESQVFPDADTRERIKILCEKYGKLLYPKHPLGYDDSQALIVFPHNTPNNTLPIIWASDRNEKEPGYVWYPVWERIKRTEKKIKGVTIQTSHSE